MKIVEILYITNNPIDMIKYDLVKETKLILKKELKPLNALVFEDNKIRKIYYIQPVKAVLDFIKYRLFDEVINLKMVDKQMKAIIKQSLR